VILTAVTLVLCPHCLDGCRSHPVLPAHRCRTEGCALYDAMVPYEGLHGAVAEKSAETRSEALERWEKEGLLDPECFQCGEFRDFPGMPWDCFAPLHKPNPGCDSGQRPHCTCDSCF
jgi:hypothetical protein